MGKRIERIDARRAAKERARNQLIPPNPQTDQQVRDSQPGRTPYANMRNLQDQDVEQDNDITSTVTGDNNYVYNNQDNSIRQYGGDNRQFTYVGGKDTRLDTPASMATLSGIWDVDDSPAKQAKFVDLYSSLNADNQKKYANTSHIAEGAIARANRNSTIDTNALDDRIYNCEMYSRSKLTCLVRTCLVTFTTTRHLNGSLLSVKKK